MAKPAVSIGKSVVIKGDVFGSEEMTIEGQVEGSIELQDHGLTIGSSAEIKGQVAAKIVTIMGAVIGNVVASEKVDIREKGSVDGDIIAPRVAMGEGTRVRGKIDTFGGPGANGNGETQKDQWIVRSPTPSTASRQPEPVAV